jgi:hypothetical protein
MSRLFKRTGQIQEKYGSHAGIQAVNNAYYQYQSDIAKE